MKSIRKLLISYIAIFFLTIIASVGVTYAWVAEHKSVDSNGAKLLIQEVSDITNISCYVLKYDGIEQASCTLIERGNTYQITMSEFDMIFRDRNVNTPLIIRLIVSDLANDVRTNPNGRFTINIPCSSGYKNENGHIIGTLSNVLTIKCGCGLTSSKTLDNYGATIEGNEKVNIFRGAIASMENNLAADSDEYISGEEERIKKDIINLRINYDDYKNHIQVLEIDGIQKDVIILNIEFNYVTDLVEDYVNSYGGFAPSNDFISDIGTIYIEWDKAL